MRKKKTISVSKVSNKIPVINFYDNGIFEVSKGFYTEMFVIEQSRIQDAEIFKHKMNQLYLGMPKDCMYQMVVHNALIEREDYLRSVLVSQDKISQAAVYNKTILETIDIGCNNVQKQVYLVVGYKTTSMEKALNYFDEQESVIKKAFQDIRIRNLSSLERLEVIYRIFHPKRNDFRRILDLRNDGNIQLSNLKYLKMTEKDLVAPKEWDTAQKLVNHTILDKNMETQSYSRTLFLNCIPQEVSINVISDLTSTSTIK